MGHETENTLASVQKALDLGVDMIEIDVFKIQSGEIVVFHDKKVDRLANAGGNIEEYNMFQLRQLVLDGGHKIPMLQEVLKLLEELDKGFDFVAGWRYPRVDPLLNRMQSSAFNFLARRFTRAKFHDLNCKVRAMRRRVPDEIEIYGDLFRFLPILAERRGFRIAEVQLEHQQELGKVGFFGFGAYIRRILDLTTMFFLIKFTKKPLRFFGLVGFAFILVGVLICLYLTYEKLFAGQGLSGRPMLVLGVMMIVLGMQTISIGLIGEMIIFTHAKGMKEYQIDQILE